MRYIQTNRLNDVSQKDAEKRIDSILREIFEGIYSCEHHGMLNVAKTRMDAFLDALNGKTGRAESYEIRERERMDEGFDRAVQKSGHVIIYMNGLWESTRRIVNYIQLLESDTGQKITVELIDDTPYDEKCLLGVEILPAMKLNDNASGLVFHVCRHIYELDISSLEHRWVDGWRNVIFDKEDFEKYRGFRHAYHIFRLCFEDRVKDAMRKSGGDFANV